MRLTPFRTFGLALIILILCPLGTRPGLRALPIQDESELPFGIDSDDVRTIADVDFGPESRVISPTMSLEATRVWVKLQEPVEFHFGDGTTLEDLVKFVRDSTRDSARFPKGIPIYVDPNGLQDVDKTMQSPITIELDGLPLGKTFAIALKQLGLVYTIEPAGYVEVTSMGCDESLIDPGAVMLERMAAIRREIRALRIEIKEMRTAAGSPPSGMPEPPAVPARKEAGRGFR